MADAAAGCWACRKLCCAALRVVLRRMSEVREAHSKLGDVLSQIPDSWLLHEVHLTGSSMTSSSSNQVDDVANAAREARASPVSHF